MSGVPLQSKNTIRRAINKVNVEVSIIEKIITALNEIYAMSAGEKTDKIIETLDKEIEEIGYAVDLIILSVEQHLQLKIELPMGKQNQY